MPKCNSLRSEPRSCAAVVTGPHRDLHLPGVVREHPQLHREILRQALLHQPLRQQDDAAAWRSMPMLRRHEVCHRVGAGCTLLRNLHPLPLR